MRKRHFSIVSQCLCFIAAIFILSAVSAFGADDDHRPQIVSGQVVEIDPAAEEVTINYRDSSGTALAYMTLSVPSDAVLKAGKDTIGLEEIQVGDRLEVEFTGDPMDNPTAKRINDLDRTNWNE